MKLFFLICFFFAYLNSIFLPLLIDRLERFKDPFKRLTQRPVLSLSKEQEKVVQEIAAKEGYTHFNPIMFRDLYRTFLEERNTFPNASYHLDDGLHRSFAIAELLIKNEIEFTPIVSCYSEVIE